MGHYLVNATKVQVYLWRLQWLLCIWTVEPSPDTQKLPGRTAPERRWLRTKREPSGSRLAMGFHPASAGEPRDSESAKQRRRQMKGFFSRSFVIPHQSDAFRMRLVEL